VVNAGLPDRHRHVCSQAHAVCSAFIIRKTHGSFYSRDNSQMCFSWNLTVFRVRALMDWCFIYVVALQLKTCHVI